MAHSQMQEHIVFRWMSLKSTIEYLGEWEMLYNPNFNCTEFDTIRNAAGSNYFVLSVKESKTATIGHKIADGAYSTMIERITSLRNPHLFVMTYAIKAN